MIHLIVLKCALVFLSQRAISVKHHIRQPVLNEQS